MIVNIDGTTLYQAVSDSLFGNPYEWEFNPMKLRFVKRPKKHVKYRDGSVLEAINWVLGEMELNKAEGIQQTILDLCQEFVEQFEIERKPGYTKEKLASSVYKRRSKLPNQGIRRRVTRQDSKI